MGTQDGDWLAHVEGCYDLARSPADWLARLAATAAPLIPRSGLAVIAFEFDVTATTFRLGEVGVAGPAVFAERVRQTNAQIPEQQVDLLYRGGLPGGTLSTTLFVRYPEARQPFLDNSAGAVRDVMGWAGHTGLGAGVMLSVPCAHETALEPAEARRWRRLTAHMAAGLRLRRRLQHAADTHDRIEAVLDPGGRISDARGAAREDTARDRLRAAVLAHEHARTRAGRADPDAALDAWQGLIDGRWSLVDRFDSDGRRHVVAYRNDAEHPDPRGLSQRERQVAALLGLGHNTKEIAYTLGATGNSVDNTVARTLRKLGLAGRAELALFFSPAGLRAKLAETAISGERLLLGAYPLADAARLDRLSEAERGIAALLLLGATNAEIARRRGTSALTVAAQVSAVYRKLGVRSRTELAATLPARTAESRQGVE